MYWFWRGERNGVGFVRKFSQLKSGVEPNGQVSEGTNPGGGNKVNGGSTLPSGDGRIFLPRGAIYSNK